MANEISIKKAALITACSKYINIFLGIFFSSILSRILTPNDYGIVAIVSVFTTFFTVLSNCGIGSAVVQRKDFSQDNINSLFTFSFYFAVILALGFMGIAWPIARFYKNDVYISICLILSVSVFFNTLNLVPNGLLSRDKKFLLIGIRLIVVSFLTYGTTIVLALLGFKYYALVIQSVIQSTLIFLWNLKNVKVAFKMRPELSVLLSVRSYTGFQFLFNFVNYFSRNLDKLIIGKALGNEDLAQYNKAYHFMLYPVQQITNVITPVLHPILSDYQNDVKTIYEKYLKVVKTLSLIGCFVQPLCYCCAREIILILYGSQWNVAVDYFQILSIAIWVQMISGTSGSLFMAAGDSRTMFFASIINTSITITGLFIGMMSHDVLVVSRLIALAYLIQFPITFFALIKITMKMKINLFIKAIAPDFVILLLLHVGGFFILKFIFIENLIVSGIVKGSILFIFYIVLALSLGQLKYVKMIFQRKNKNQQKVSPRRQRALHEKIVNKLSFIARKVTYKLVSCLVFILLSHKKIAQRGKTVPVVVSLTSFEPRFKNLHLVLKSLLNQSFRPEKIILYLDKTVSLDSLPVEILALQKFGVEIRNICEDYVCHKKYFYSMQEFPDKCIVTVDDDVIYSRNLIKKLYSSYLKYPGCVSAMRVHLITYDENGKCNPYNEWHWNYKKLLEPSPKLVSTGVGGVLYPPSVMPSETFAPQVFSKLCLGADDIWLKFNELNNGIDVVRVPSLLPSYYMTDTSRIGDLRKANVIERRNDLYIHNCEEFFSIHL